MATPEQQRGFRRMGTILLFTGAALLATGVALAVAASQAYGDTRSLLFFLAGAFGLFGAGDLGLSAWARRRASL
jgi:hypothetical protein